MLKKLLCNHKYKYYNKRIRYGSGSHGYYVFQFVCPNCKKVIEISEYDIKDEYDRLEEEYNRNLILGGNSVEESSFSHPRNLLCNMCYNSPVATIMINKYLKKGIDLRELNSL